MVSKWRERISSMHSRNREEILPKNQTGLCSKGTPKNGVWRFPCLRFASADASSAEVTGGAGGRVPVGFGSQRRSGSKARSSECRWDLLPGKHRERAGVIRVPVVPGGIWSTDAQRRRSCAGVIWVQESSENELGSAVCRWIWLGGGSKDGGDGGVCR